MQGLASDVEGLGRRTVVVSLQFSFEIVKKETKKKGKNQALAGHAVQKVIQAMRWLVHREAPEIRMRIWAADK